MSHPSRSTTRNALPLILYDVKGPSAQPWMPSIWRIRFILNYKRLHYKTTWLEWQDIEHTIHELGAAPTSRRSDGRGVYTLPVLCDQARRQVISNPNHIAEYLEQNYPARPVFPEGSRAMQSLFVHHIQELFSKPLLPLMVPLSYQQLPPTAQQYFRPGEPVASLDGPLRTQQWTAVKKEFDFLDMIMSKNDEGEGAVAMGNEVTYADFALCAVLIWIHRTSPHDVWSTIRSWNNGRWNRLMDRCRHYMDEQ